MLPRRASVMTLVLGLTLGCSGGGDGGGGDPVTGQGGSLGGGGSAGSMQNNGVAGSAMAGTAGANVAGANAAGQGGAAGTAPGGVGGDAGQAGGTAGMTAAGGMAGAPVDRYNMLRIRPLELDPGVKEWNDEQVAMHRKDATEAGKLAMYLASGPIAARLNIEMLADFGFHAVGIAYAHEESVTDGGCGGDNDPDCMGKKRLEIVEGINHSPHITVVPADSIEMRLTKLLAELDKRQPDADWEKFLVAGKPNWPLIVVGGHSRGASMSARIGKVRAVSRVVCLSGPNDGNGNQPAPWITSTPAAGPAAFYGFAHANEPGYGDYSRMWTAMKLDQYGPVVSVDNATPPFGNSHRLSTATKDFIGLAHGSTNRNPASPRVNGAYVFMPVWQYMFGGNAPPK